MFIQRHPSTFSIDNSSQDRPDVAARLRAVDPYTGVVPAGLLGEAAIEIDRLRAALTAAGAPANPPRTDRRDRWN